MFKSNHKLQTLLGNTKNKVNDFERSAIYKIKCYDCDNKFILCHLGYRGSEKSCENYKYNNINLDAWERLEISKFKNLMNNNKGQFHFVQII